MGTTTFCHTEKIRNPDKDYLCLHLIRTNKFLWILLVISPLYPLAIIMSNYLSFSPIGNPLFCFLFYPTLYILSHKIPTFRSIMALSLITVWYGMSEWFLHFSRAIMSRWSSKLLARMIPMKSKCQGHFTVSRHRPDDAPRAGYSMVIPPVVQ